MDQLLHIVCPDCQTTNRMQRDKAAAATCGKCRTALFTGHPVELTSSAFAKHLDRNDIPMVVDFWAPWCGPCHAMAPAYQAAARQLEPTVRFAKVNTDEEQDLAARFGIQSIPTMILFQGRSRSRAPIGCAEHAANHRLDPLQRELVSDLDEVSGGRHFSFHREVRQKRFDLLATQFLRVPLPVKDNEPPDPLNIRFFSSNAVMLQPDRVTDLIEKP